MAMNIKLACALLAAAAHGAASASPFERVAWLQGCWGMTNGAEPGSGEQWTSAAGGAMLGMARTVRNGKMVNFEFVQIRETTPGRLAYIAQPGGAAPTTFVLVQGDAGELVFENPAHDFPQRVIYRRAGDSALHARIEGTINGKAKGIDFPMKRVSCTQ